MVSPHRRDDAGLRHALGYRLRTSAGRCRVDRRLRHDLGQRIESTSGRSRAYWIDLEGPIVIKSRIDDARHQEEVCVLRQVFERRWR
jgi:hypothetical protein